MRLNGTVKFFNSTRGFGFISPENGEKDVFVHASALESSGVPALKEGDKVSFEIRTTFVVAASRPRTLRCHNRAKGRASSLVRNSQ